MAKEHNSASEPRIYDPACGDGSLLRACAAIFGSDCVLLGSDLSDTAVARAKAFLDGERCEIRTGDSLLSNYDLAQKADICVMNPPWGASLPNLDELHEAGFKLAGGSHDSWETFMEWSFKMLRPGCLVIAILPGSLTQGQRRAVPNLLEKSAEIIAVADLGEGIFEDVYRTSYVVVFRTQKGKHLRETVNYHLNHLNRKAVRDGSQSLGEALKTKLAVPRPASLEQITASQIKWSDFLKVTRGVELGAKGRVERCLDCGLYRPATKSRQRCSRCGGSSLKPETIVCPQQQPGTVPLIVGRDVKRFNAEPANWLKIGLEGIRYKPTAQYEGPKLLIRKTGLGLNTAVDETSSFTNQVVFSYRPSLGVPDWWLYYFLGVLASDAMLAYHVSRTGDSEWRSHPYVTPASLRNYPLPVPGAHCGEKEASAVADVAKILNSLPHNAPRSAFLDELNHQVETLLGFRETERTWIQEVLSNTQNLSSFDRRSKR
nr:N-6 DNA methylase [Corynebacterium sp. CNCTC7651]